MKLIFGLGNPGRKYEKTKHNIGFLALDAMAQKHGFTFGKTKFNAIYAEGNIGTEKVVLIKPQTYMNLSGESVRPWVDFYDVTEEDIVVIYDDMDLNPGVVRLRMQGGHGGHNGMKSIIQHLGTKQFNRVRVGIGRPFPQQDVVSHVLSQFPNDAVEDMKISVNTIVDALTYWIQGHTFIDTMNAYN